MKVLVTGANGMLGQDLCPALEDIGCLVIETDINNLDITDTNSVNEYFNGAKPDLVIHCAAYTNVDKAEDEIEKAFLINEKGTENIAKACQKINATMIYISTDYVFDGTKKTPYIPTDKTNPLNIYGKSKLAGENAVRKYCDKHYIARTSWLYGHHGKNFVETMISIAKNPEINVVEDQIGCPTWTYELINGILTIIKEQKEYGTYHICGSGTTSWFGFAKEIYKLTNLTVNLQPTTTDKFPRPAQRPTYSVMENNAICRDWKKALKDYINLRCE